MQDYVKIPMILCVLPGLIMGGVALMDFLKLPIWYGAIGAPLLYVSLKYYLGGFSSKI